MSQVLMSNNLNLLALICQTGIVGDVAMTFATNVLSLLSDHLDDMQIESFIKRLIKTKITHYRK
jgi:hypothetical protein